MVDVVTLCLGPALDSTTATDHVEPNRKLRCDIPRHDAGGGGINVARLLHALGKSALAVFPAGGSTGDDFERLVRATDTPYRRVSVAGATRQSFCVNDRAAHVQYRFVLPGTHISPAEQQACLDALAVEAVGARYLVLSGSIPEGVPTVIIRRIAECARVAGARLIVDTSGVALREALGAGAWLIKPNLEELEDLAGRRLQSDVQIEEAARDLRLSGNADILLVSLAERGALVVTAHGVTRISAFDIVPAGGSGTGDSMIAGLICGLLEGLDVADAVRFGAAAGAAALMAPGTAMADPAQIRFLYASAGGATPKRAAMAL
ncbi:MAG TPA: 1-phosphofructokinase family hexose kinase [Sphingomonas sp.]